MTSKIRIVYVLISDGEDDFCEMTLLSLYSLRHYNPKVEVCILTDESTCQIFSSRYGSAPEGAQFLTVSIPKEYEKKKRSRYLKTTLRSHVSGDFLFLDCDTLICGSLDELESLNCDVGCVPDLNSQNSLSLPSILSLCKKNGFEDLQGKPYYNSGVIFAKDTPLCRQLFAEWHRLWLISSAKESVVDQPAFCQANINSGYPIQEIPAKWNCMIQTNAGKAAIKNAAIIHYFSSPSSISLPRRVLIESIKDLGQIGTSLENIVRNPKTIGVAVFSSEMGRGNFTLSFLFSELLFAYCSVQPLYQFVLKCTKALLKPSLFLIQSKEQMITCFNRVIKPRFLLRKTRNKE